jgi:hypothetical protein
MIRELFRRKMGRVYSPEIREEHRFYMAKHRYRRLLYAHCPPRYPERLMLIVNEQQSRMDPDLGWRGYADGGLQLRTSPGSHETMFTEHRRAAAETILQCIDEAIAAPAPETQAEGIL